MKKDLTNSVVERQNLLNNHYALAEAENHLQLVGIEFKGERVFTKEQVVDLFDVSESTIEKYLANHNEELTQNGYVLIKGRKLREFKELSSATVINYGSKTTVLGLFSFRAVLNLAMLLTESERAKLIRSRLLDISLDVIAKRTGGHTKYINQRDQDYLPAAYQEFSYRKGFTEALRDCLEMGKMKYGIYTDKVYQAIFKENAKEYKQILQLAEKDKVRETLYAEVLRVVASFENGLAQQMRDFVVDKGRNLTPKELDNLIRQAESSPFNTPHLEDARIRMASRDVLFRGVLHHKLEAYVQSVPKADFERFLGETSKSLEERLSDPETLAVFKRLKDR